MRGSMTPDMDGVNPVLSEGETVKQFGAVIGLVIVALVVGMLTAFAQAPAAPAPAAQAATPPALDETESLMVQLVIARAQVAQSECNSLESMKNFNGTKAEVVKRIESKHAGYTIDLSSGKLVAKPAAK